MKIVMMMRVFNFVVFIVMICFVSRLNLLDDLFLYRFKKSILIFMLKGSMMLIEVLCFVVLIFSSFRMRVVMRDLMMVFLVIDVLKNRVIVVFVKESFDVLWIVKVRF